VIDLVIAIVAGAFGALSGWLSLRKTQVESKANAENQADQKAEQEDLRALVVSFCRFFAKNSAVSEQLHELLSATEIDRILLFRAEPAPKIENAEDEDLLVSCYMQLRAGNQIEYPFEELRVDRDYKLRLLDTFKEDQVLHVASEMPEKDCQIGDIYRLEGVTESLWVRIVIIAGPKESNIYQYMSFATHSEEGISRNTATKISLITSQITDLAVSYYSPHELLEHQQNSLSP
tara:strand:+ start:3018 stop:3716 length:699 start_codon:yes stop_codon:yes gene_type:complete